MNKNSIKTFWARIFIGTFRQYEPFVHRTEADFFSLIGTLSNQEKICLEVSRTSYVYPGAPHGGEPGYVVGIIAYPRFPQTKGVLRKKALKIAETLRRYFEQHRVSVMFPDETILVGEENKTLMEVFKDEN